MEGEISVALSTINSKQHIPGLIATREKTKKGNLLTQNIEHSNINSKFIWFNMSSDVRTHFARFACSFLELGDPQLGNDILSLQNFLGNFFKGLSGDVYEVPENQTSIERTPFISSL